MNDSAYIKKIAEDLIEFCNLLWFTNRQDMQLDEQEVEEIASQK